MMIRPLEQAFRIQVTFMQMVVSLEGILRPPIHNNIDSMQNVGRKTLKRIKKAAFAAIRTYSGIWNRISK